MMNRSRRLPLSVLSRYLFTEFWGLFSLILMSFVGLYVIIDLFDRLNFFFKNDATVGAALRYVGFKLPLIVTQMVPPAVLAGVLLSLGVLGRRNELTALRAGGISLYRIARPLLVTAGAISLIMLLWGETIVPLSMRRQQEVSLIEIRKQAPRTVLGDRATWYHGADGFYHIDLIDRTRQTLYGIVIYHLDPEFRLTHMTEIDSARWEGDHWQVTDAVERRVTPSREVEVMPIAGDGLLRQEKLEDFLEVFREPEELSYTSLNDRIDTMRRKGIDTSSYLVDLHLKLAVPFMSLVLAALAIPIAARPRRHASVAITLGIGIVVGFAYWLVFAFGVSLGHSGAIPPFLAAWSANIICLLAATLLFLSVD
jgi:lipopolysaccharide export system permease protein